MNGQRIAILESRAAAQVAALVQRYGGIPISAPALAEVADTQPELVRDLIERHAATPPALAIFQTGVGTRALFETALELGLADTLARMLDHTVVAVRGPKPTAVLRGQGVRIDRTAAAPYTTHELLAAIADVPIDGQPVLVQRYGESNASLNAALEARGAVLEEIPTYRWALPELMAAFPFELVENEFFNPTNIDGSVSFSTAKNTSNLKQLMKLPRIYRLFRLARLIKMVTKTKTSDYLVKIQEVFKLNSGFISLINYLVIISVAINFMGCVWFFEAKIRKDLNQELGCLNCNFKIKKTTFYIHIQFIGPAIRN